MPTLQDKYRCTFVTHGYMHQIARSLQVVIPIEIIELCIMWLFVPSNHIKTFARFKPHSLPQTSSTLSIIDDHNFYIIHPDKHSHPTPKKFTFDRVFGTNSSQNTLFEYIGKDLVYETFEGYNTALIVTGDTETGKTLSIEGIIHRAINMIYDTISCNKTIEYKVRMRYIQIAYNQVTDLLATIDDNADHDDMNYIYKITEGMAINNKKHLLKALNIGHENIKHNRLYSSTDGTKNSVNANHILLCITLCQTNKVNATYKESKMQFVDIGPNRESTGGFYGDRRYDKMNKDIDGLQKFVRRGFYDESYYDKINILRELKPMFVGNYRTRMLITCTTDGRTVMIDQTIKNLEFGLNCRGMQMNAKMNITYYLQETFDFFDKNGDGKIGAEELREGLLEMGMNQSEEDVKQMIAKVDVDGKGFIYYAEFVKMMASLESSQT